ncbi:hypothetical protein GmHk_04G011654 [Glycine max]|nr:hypothetical protein GmHk_04G011654 [Glycine max]
MAGLPARIRLQPTDVKAAALWGVTAVTGALYLVQLRKIMSDLRICALCLVWLLAFGDPWGWLKKTFLEKPDPEQK